MIMNVKLSKWTNPAWLKEELGQVIILFRKELIVVGLLSLVVNVLMLAPTFYMLQVYDRVMVRSHLDDFVRRDCVFVCGDGDF